VHVVLGLGNPGGEYAGTRHNVGFRVASCLGRRWKCALSSSGGHCRWGMTRVAGTEVVLARPSTFMNASGEAARTLCERFGVEPESLLVVCDDIDLPLGRLRLRASGGAGGHRGLGSIAAELNTERFPRLRIGVGRPPEGLDAADYVLSAFEGQEEETLAKVVDLAADAVEAVLRKSLMAAMTEFNGLSVERDGSSDEEPGGC
jgi:PTH1 family peptidyl-tRNA hydrolase